jgi:hypothetical protein
MSTRHHDPNAELDAGVRAYGLLGINPFWLQGDPSRQRALVDLVRRLRACGYDAADCIGEDAPVALRSEVHALARALKGVDA